MSNVLSANINVFPSTKRGNYQRSARLISESNLVGIVNKLLDSDKFVITQNVSGIAPLTSPFEINIHGYYFIIDTCNLIITSVSPSSSNTSIWANIITGVTDGYTELVGQDSGGDNSTYGGISFSLDGAETSALSAGQTRYSLKILEKSGNDWVIPQDSSVKYSATRFMGNIDGGVI